MGDDRSRPEGVSGSGRRRRGPRQGPGSSGFEGVRAEVVDRLILDSELLTTLRLRWEYRPGSDFFVVYNDGRATGLDEPLFLESRTLSVKLTRLVRF